MSGELELPAIVQRFKADVSGLLGAEKAFSVFGSNVGSSLATVSSNLTKFVSLPLLGVVSAAVKAGETVQDAYSKIERATGATGQAAAGLKKVFDNVFSTVPDSANDVADTISTLHQRLQGLNDIQLGDVSKKLLALKELTGSALDPDQVAKFVNAFQISPDQISKQLNTMAAIYQKTGTSVQSQLQYATLLRPNAQAVGYNVDQILEIVGKTQQAGLNPAVLNTVMARINQNAAKNQVKPEDLYNSVIAAIQGGNVSATGALSPNAGQATAQQAAKLQTLNDQLKKLQSQNAGNTKNFDATKVRDQIATTQASISTLQSKIDPSSGTSETTAEVAKLLGAKGFSQFSSIVKSGSLDTADNLGLNAEDVEQMVDKTRTISQQLQILKNQATVALKPLGLDILSAANSILSTLIPAFQKLTTWFDNLSPSVKNLLGDLGKIGIVAGPAMFGIAKIASSGTSFVKSALGLLGGGAGGAASAAGGAGGAASTLAGDLGSGASDLLGNASSLATIEGSATQNLGNLGTDKAIEDEQRALAGGGALAGAPRSVKEVENARKKFGVMSDLGTFGPTMASDVQGSLFQGLSPRYEQQAMSLMTPSYYDRVTGKAKSAGRTFLGATGFPGYENYMPSLQRDMLEAPGATTARELRSAGSAVANSRVMAPARAVGRAGAATGRGFASVGRGFLGVTGFPGYEQPELMSRFLESPGETMASPFRRAGGAAAGGIRSRLSSAGSFITSYGSRPAGEEAGPGLLRRAGGGLARGGAAVGETALSGLGRAGGGIARAGGGLLRGAAGIGNAATMGLLGVSLPVAAAGAAIAGLGIGGKVLYDKGTVSESMANKNVSGTESEISKLQYKMNSGSGTAADAKKLAEATARLAEQKKAASDLASADDNLKDVQAKVADGSLKGAAAAKALADAHARVKKAQDEVKTSSTGLTKVAIEFHDAWDATWKVVSKVVDDAWKTYIQPAFKAIAQFVTNDLPPALRVMGEIFKTVWDVISTAIQVAWKIIQPIMKLMIAIWKDELRLAFELVRDIIKVGWAVISDAVKTAWSIFGPIITTIIDTVKGPLSDIWHDLEKVVGDVWDSISGKISGTVGGIMSIIKGFLGGVADVLSAIGMTDTAKALNSFVNGSSSQGVMKPGETGIQMYGYASGGVMNTSQVAAGTKTNKPTYLIGEGGYHPEYVIPTDPKHRSNALGLLGQLSQDLGLKAFGGGGVMSDIGSGITSAGNLVKRGAVDTVMAPIRVAQAGVSAAVDVANAVKGFAQDELAKVWQPMATTGAPLTDLVPNGVNMLRNAVLGRAGDYDSAKKAQQATAGPAAAAAPAGQIVDWIHQAEQIAGWPDAYTNGLYQLIMHESGGNPTAINLTDSNAKAGHPSQGLMQTIPSTFAAYMFPGHGQITNPVDNILAGTAYALKNYGPAMIEAGGRHDSKGNYIGYSAGGMIRAGINAMAAGGIVTKDTIHRLGESGHEAVLPLNSKSAQRALGMDRDTLVGAMKEALNGANIGNNISITGADERQALHIANEVAWKTKYGSR